jgi:hypothetical protein
MRQAETAGCAQLLWVQWENSGQLLQLARCHLNPRLKRYDNVVLMGLVQHTSCSIAHITPASPDFQMNQDMGT